MYRRKFFEMVSSTIYFKGMEISEGVIVRHLRGNKYSKQMIGY